jgi:cyclomaltodextrinase / maltogenic alpha-amylase / neopullulanase
MIFLSLFCGYFSMIKPGRYRHFKGNEYEVVGVARDSETLEELVVYRALYGERGLWVRSARMFAETIERDGRVTPRFEYLGDGAVDG